MKYLSNRTFLVAIPTFCFILALPIIWCHYYIFGIEGVEARIIVINAVLMLFATFIAVSLSLYVDIERKKKDAAEELKVVYISTARYVGEELANNMIRVEDIVSHTEIALGNLKADFPSAGEEARVQQKVGAWQTTAEEVLVGLEDVNYRALIMSGTLAKIQDDPMSTTINDSYSKMLILKQQARRIGIFFSMIITPPSSIPSQVISEMLKTKVPESVEMFEKDINMFVKSAKTAIEKINETIRPYGKEVAIVKEELEGNHD